jgi:hypothetical protein
MGFLKQSAKILLSLWLLGSLLGVAGGCSQPTVQPTPPVAAAVTYTEQ